MIIDENVPQNIVIDPKRYKQVIFNLIGNSLKFTFRGGITVEVSVNADMLETRCLDTGVGIKEEEMNSLFKSFGKL